MRSRTVRAPRGYYAEGAQVNQEQAVMQKIMEIFQSLSPESQQALVQAMTQIMQQGQQTAPEQQGQISQEQGQMDQAQMYQ